MNLKRIKKYLLMTFAISWVIWGTLIVLINNGVTAFSDPLGFIIFVAGGFGPPIAAIAMQERVTLKSVVKFVFNGKHKAIPYLLLFSLLIGVTLGFSSQGLSPDMTLYLFLINLLIMTFFGGGFEELGWRGLMQPLVEKSLPFPVAVLLTGITWSVWHLPLWFIAGGDHQAISFAAYTAMVVALSFALAAIRRKTNCVFYCCVFHGLVNTLMACFVVELSLSNWIMMLGFAVIIIVSLLIWLVDRHRAA